METKNILIIDTSNADCIFLGLTKGDIIVDNKKIKTKHKHSEKLIPSIEIMLKKNKLSLKKLSAIGVVRGPGSYTALKIGLTVANVLAWGLDIAVVGLKEDEFENTDDLAKKIFKKIKTKNKFKKIVEPFYNNKAYYQTD